MICVVQMGFKVSKEIEFDLVERSLAEVDRSLLVKSVIITSITVLEDYTSTPDPVAACQKDLSRI